MRRARGGAGNVEHRQVRQVQRGTDKQAVPEDKTAVREGGGENYP